MLREWSSGATLRLFLKRWVGTQVEWDFGNGGEGGEYNGDVNLSSLATI